MAAESALGGVFSSLLSVGLTAATCPPVASAPISSWAARYLLCCGDRGSEIRRSTVYHYGFTERGAGQPLRKVLDDDPFDVGAPWWRVRVSR